MDTNSIAGMLFGLGFFLLILTAMVLSYLHGNRAHKERLAKIQKEPKLPTSERASLMKSKSGKKTKRPYRRILKKVR